MAIDFNLIDLQSPARLSQQLNPNVAIENQNRLASLAQENQMRKMQMMQAQQEMQRAPELARRQAQQEAQRQAALSQATPEQQKMITLGVPAKDVFMREKPEDALGARKLGLMERELAWKMGQGPKKTPLSATAQKELFEAEDIATSSENVISLLEEAKKLNSRAYSGYGAKTRAVVRSNIPGESEAADATIALDNLMTGQALESLKSTFGGMPTEGERKILLEIQASAEKTPKQRLEIMERAQKAAQNRMVANRKKAEKLRSGEYFSETQQEPSVNVDSLLEKYK